MRDGARVIFSGGNLHERRCFLHAEWSSDRPERVAAELSGDARPPAVGGALGGDATAVRTADAHRAPLETRRDGNWQRAFARRAVTELPLIVAPPAEERRAFRDAARVRAAGDDGRKGRRRRHGRKWFLGRQVTHDRLRLFDHRRGDRLVLGCRVRRAGDDDERETGEQRPAHSNLQSSHPFSSAFRVSHRIWRSVCSGDR